MLGADRWLVLTQEHLVQLELDGTIGEFRFDVLHHLPPSRFGLRGRLISPTGDPNRFVFATCSSASNAELHLVDVQTRAVWPSGSLQLASGWIGGLHVHAGVLYVVGRDASRITSIYALDPTDGRLIRVVKAAITHRGFPPSALAFHDHSAVFLEQLIVQIEGREDRVLQPRVCRLELRSGEWTAAETPIVDEIAASCWYSEWKEAETTWLEPVDLLHVDKKGTIKMHVRASLPGTRTITGRRLYTWRSYRLHGQPISLLRLAFEAIDPADRRALPQTATIERVYR
ncbi:hypothetical protein M3Y99_01528500 [Aphelenchoides fujianensis]|nr:hypothetical protein M3Y99_01528500 [Aphelenchoides fujianensis]